MTKRYRKTILLYLIFLHCFSVQGQKPDSVEITRMFSLSLEEIMNIKVVTASKNEEPIDDAPNVMYVITKEQVKKRGYRNLKDLLITIPGFNAFYRDLDFVSQLRGIAPNGHNKVAFLINGQRINNLTETSILYGPINLETFERIEVIVGPGSVMYGSENLLATVNMITGKFSENEVIVTTGINVMDDPGIEDLFSTTANLGKAWEDDKYIRTSFTYYQRDGWSAWDSTASRANLHNTTYTGKIFPSYFFMADGRFEGWEMQFVNYNGDQPELNTMDHRDTMMKEGHRFDFMDDMKISNEHAFTDHLSTIFCTGYSNQRMTRQTTSGTGQTYDLSQKSYRLEAGIKYKKENLFIQSGIQFKHKQHRQNYVLNWSPDDPSLSDSTSKIKPIVEFTNTNVYGAYLSCEYDISKKLKLTGAIRGDYDEIIKKKKIYPSPRISLMYKPWNHLISKVMFNRAVKMPDAWFGPLNMIWGKDNPISNQTYVNNPRANNPEKFTAIEWQTIYYTGWEDNLRLNLNIYYHELKDFISWYRPFTNVGDFYGAGGELTMHLKANSRWQTWVNASYNANSFVITADSLQQDIVNPVNADGESIAAPKIKLTWGNELEFIDNLYITPLVRYFTFQPAGVDEMIMNRYYIDLCVYYKDAGLKNLDVKVSACNLLNNKKPVAQQYSENKYSPLGLSLALSAIYSF